MRMACCLQSTCTCTCCSRNYRSCGSSTVFAFVVALAILCQFSREKFLQEQQRNGNATLCFTWLQNFTPAPKADRSAYYMCKYTHTHTCMHMHFLPGRTDLVFGLGNIIYAGGMINNNGVHWLPHGLAAILAFETVTVILQLNIKSGNLTFTAIVTATATATVSVQHRSGKFVPRLFCFYTQIESEISLLLLLLLL